MIYLLDVSRELSLGFEFMQGFKPLCATWYFCSLWSFLHLSFSFFFNFFLCHEQSTLLSHKGIAQIPSSSLFLIWFAWVFYSTPSHSGERGATWRLLLSTPAGLGSAMIQALNSPLLLCSQLATLRNGQASSTRMGATLIPTNLITQLLLPRFCLDIFLCTEGIRNALVLQSVLPETFVESTF